jgi:hypothetical protein
MDHKEHLLYFFLTGKINLSQYDHKFLSNLQLMVHKDSRVTTNQADLFDKLISKYTRQLTKHGYDKESLKSLSWKALVVESSILHTGARVSIENDQLVLRLPFNKNFISSFRETVHNPFEWHRDQKQYMSKFSTHSLKILYNVLPKFFPTVIYCEHSKKIIDELKNYEAKFWEPTLTVINDRPTVVAVNYILGDMLANVELSISPKTFFELSLLGVKIDPMLIGDDPKLKFASEMITEIDLDDFPTVASWMLELGCNRVLFGRGMNLGPNRSIQSEIIKIIEGLNITHALKYVDINEKIDYNAPPMLLQYPRNNKLASLREHHEPISKCIIIKNKRPIDIK